MSVSTCSFNAIQFSVMWSWSLWNLQYKFFGRLSGSEWILPGHRREGSSCICMWSWLMGVFRGVKQLNFPLGTVVLFLSGVSKNLGTFCFIGSCLRSSISFLLLRGGSSWDLMASSMFMLRTWARIMFLEGLCKGRKGSLPFAIPPWMRSGWCLPLGGWFAWPPY